MRILMNLNVSKETFRNHRGILRTCFFPPFFQDHERAYFDSADWVLGKVTRGTDQPANAAAEIHAILCSRWLTITPSLFVCLFVLGSKARAAATARRSRPPSPSSPSCRYVKMKNKKRLKRLRLPQSLLNSKALTGASVFSSPKRTAYHQLPPRRPACTSE